MTLLIVLALLHASAMPIQQFLLIELNTEGKRDERMVGKIEGEANERSRKGFTVFTAFIPSPVGSDSVVHCREPHKQLGKGEQGSVCAANEA